jgi:DNA repair exonuclease SbcCD nuclease subunit
MKVALITDQHFGARNDSIHFLDFYEKFYEYFFKELDKRSISRVFILGDTFDRRKYVNFYSFQRAKNMFFDKLKERNISVCMLVGNHDTYYKNTNSVNSPELLLMDYDNIQIINDPTTIEIENTKICMIPWICSENYDASMNELRQSESTICMGHFEIQGFQMYRGAPSHEGLDPKIFDRFDCVFSGHYHHKSSFKNIHYLGNPYELTWQDYDDHRGFHIFDLTSHKLEFIKNPYSIFYKIIYDDKREEIKTIQEMDLTPYSSTYVKIVVVHKTNPYLFDMFVNKLYQVNPIDISITEDFFDNENEEDIEVNEAEDTTTILNRYVDNLATDLNKDKLKTIFRQLYIEALNEETQ